MSKVQRKTTYFATDGVPDPRRKAHPMVVDPVEPDGDGWRMTGSAASEVGGSLMLFWFWARPVTSDPCLKCRAIAFKDGRCVGCGTPQGEQGDEADDRQLD